MIKRIGKIHRLLAEHHFYPLLLSSALAIGLWAFRSELWAPRSFRFLVWNLFLAWLPYFWSRWALSIHRRQPRRWWLLLLPGALWLLFFPNAPYLVTDLIHLRSYPPVPLWYDIGMLISFAWAGCFLAVASLYVMHQILREYIGRVFELADCDRNDGVVRTGHLHGALSALEQLGHLLVSDRRDRRHCASSGASLQQPAGLRCHASVCRVLVCVLLDLRLDEATHLTHRRAFPSAEKPGGWYIDQIWANDRALHFVGQLCFLQ